MGITYLTPEGITMKKQSKKQGEYQRALTRYKASLRRAWNSWSIEARLLKRESSI